VRAVAPARSLRRRHAAERIRPSSSIIARLSETAVPKAPNTCAIAAISSSVAAVATSISTSVMPDRRPCLRVIR
jgi:hypothetical protein